MQNAIVIDQKGFKTEFVLVETIVVEGQAKQTPVSYILKGSEQLIYADIGIALSMIRPQWNGTTWVETGVKEYTQEDVENKRKEKLNEINTACQNIIYAGVDVETSQGLKHFGLTEPDQINLTGMATQMEKALLGQPSTVDLAKGIPYHADGELCRFWTPEDFAIIAKSATGHVFFHQTYCNHLRQYIKTMETYDELSAAFYGITLPEELSNSMMALVGGVINA